MYGGLWVGPGSGSANTEGFRNDVLEALRRMGVPMLRWPGGCFADDYHWEDGVGPQESRPRRINQFWGQQVETNEVGTDEFLTLCRLLGAEPYLAANVGSGTPAQAKRWYEYVNYGGDSTLARQRAAHGHAAPYNVRYWGIGNELWGCGGTMTAAEYAHHYRRFANYFDPILTKPGASVNEPGEFLKPYLIACGPNGNDPRWTRELLKGIHERVADWHFRIHGLAAHYYCGTAGTATEFTTEQWYELLHRASAVEKLIRDQRQAMDEYDPKRSIDLIIDEWGTWHPPTPGRNPKHLWQQSTLRDALVAALTLDIFHRHADVVKAAAIAQIANVLQSMVLTEGDQMVLTPTYHVFEMYGPHRGSRLLRTTLETPIIRGHWGNPAVQGELPWLACSASADGSGAVTVTVTNAHAELPADLAIQGISHAHCTARVLTAEELQDHNTFENPSLVAPTPPQQVDPSRLTLPRASVTQLRFTR